MSNQIENFAALPAIFTTSRHIIYHVRGNDYDKKSIVW